ncbi:MAG: shikimate kinase [Alphaproteobacteria bacterium]|nr:shikimate kinase [Alphaproteobacteria bacterium]MBL7098559.1 shikimate kinase [Alphaproteobacteria bacterium]
MKLTRTVALVGMMGAGKSSIGRRLATRLNVPFKDADSEIESAAGCSISEIFERYGEPAFRDGERKVIARLLGEPPHVMATGGGAFVDAGTRAKMKEGSVTIWLRAPVSVLLARTGRRETRPLLKNGDPRETLERLLQERTPIYAEADVTLDSEDGPHSQSVEKIVSVLTERGALVT